MVQARLIGVCFLVVALAVGVISTALDYWYYLSVTTQGITGSVYFGLWELCTKADGKHVCLFWSDFGDSPVGTGDFDWLHGCQAMMVIGVILNAVALLAAVFAIVKHIPARVAQIASCVAGICYIIAAVIFGAKYEDSIQNIQTGGSLHAGFGLAIVAGILCLVPSCLLGVHQHVNNTNRTGLEP